MRKGYTAEIKAAVMAALLTGQSLTVIAREYNIPTGTISSWKNRPNGARAMADVSKGDEVRQRIGELVLQYLQASLETLFEQVKAFRDGAWLGKQPASEAAVLHGVLADKAMRLLEALAKGAHEGEEAQ